MRLYSIYFAGFDNAAGRLWIYPTNYPVREYQYNIVRQSLFKNCLVVLPTGQHCFPFSLCQTKPKIKG